MPLASHVRFAILALAALPALLGAAPALAQSTPNGFADTLVTSGLDLPTAFEFLPDGRILVVEQYSARVRLLVNGHVAVGADPLLTVAGVTTSGEQGLLGIAIDPKFPARPYMYTHQTVSGLHVRISRWTLTGDLAGSGNKLLACDPASRYDLINDIPDNETNHNGGTVKFGSDGMLYVSLGEDADACSAPLLPVLKGKILRLDTRSLPPGPGTAFRAQITPIDNPYVAQADSNARLVAAYGLRNPFRFQVDPLGGLVIDDVGENNYEEIDLLATGPGAVAGSVPLGANFGWPWREGTVSFSACGGGEPSSVAPAFVFDRVANGTTATVSAGVYRPVRGGSRNWPVAYNGNLFFSEYYSGVLYRLTRQGSAWAIAPAVPGQPASDKWASGYNAASDWRVGPDGGLWYCRQSTTSFRNTGIIGRIAPPTSQTAAPKVGCAVLSTWTAGAAKPLAYAVTNPIATAQSIRWTISANRNWPGLPATGLLSMNPSATDSARFTLAVPDTAKPGLVSLTFAAWVDNIPLMADTCVQQISNGTTGVDADFGGPSDRLAVLATWPAPARGAWTLHYTLPAPGPAALEVIDLGGRRVRRFEVRGARGANALAVPAGAIAPGIYWLRLHQDGASALGRVVILR